jgi:hypothetical protein
MVRDAREERESVVVGFPSSSSKRIRGPRGHQWALVNIARGAVSWSGGVGGVVHAAT